MPEVKDMDLVREYVRCESEAAFAQLVRRHINLVYSVALRCVANAEDAQDVTQTVFLILAKKAAGLCDRAVLAGWLYETTRFTAAHLRRARARRHARDQEAFMQSSQDKSDTDSVWKQLAPHLEEAMSHLGEKDRALLVLRFYENKSGAEAAAMLGIAENAAYKRTTRAVEKLRSFFSKRGIVLSGAAVAGAISANAVQAAPACWAASIAAMAVKGAAAGSSTLALLPGTMRLMTWAQYRISLGLSAVVVITAGVLISSLYDRKINSPSLAANAPTANPAVLEAPDTPKPREPFASTMHLTLYTPPGGIAVQPDGKILAAATLGGFVVDEQTGALSYYTRGAFRFNADGSLDRGFYCEVDRSGNSAAMMAHLNVREDGKIFMTGLFNSVDGKPRPGYAMLLSDGRVDESFEPWRGSPNVPQRTFLPGGTVPATLLSDGSVAVMSGAIEGPRAPHPLTVYRLDSSGQLMTPTHTNSPSSEFSRPSGLILTLGPVGFWARKPIDWTRDTPSARRAPFQAGAAASDLPGRAPVVDLPFERWTEPPSAVDAAKVFQALFEEVPLELCRYAVRLPDGGVILAIRDEVVNGSMKARGRFMRFDKDWRPDFNFMSLFEADLRSCLTLKLLKDGKLLVAGMIGTINEENFNGLVRLETNGAIDRSFRCETTNSTAGRIMGLAIQTDGRIVIGGYFDTVNGIFCHHLARLNPDGSLDPTFQPPFTTWEGLRAWRSIPVQHLAHSTMAPNTNTATNGSGTSPAIVPPETVLITSMQLDDDVVVIQISGNPRQAYILQARNSAGATGWSNIQTNQANAAGISVFRDEESKNHSMRLYRIASP